MKLVWAAGRVAVLRGEFGERLLVRPRGEPYDLAVAPQDVIPIPEELAARVGDPRPLPERLSRRPASPGAERWLGVPLLVLDHGFVILVDYMGTDESIVRAARVGTGSTSKGREDDRRLIRYLMRHAHTSPFEQVEVCFHVRLPIFVARQWVRHRTAHLNEHSARYSVLRDEFYLPDVEAVARQDASNRQGRGEPLPEPDAQSARGAIDTLHQAAYRVYTELLRMGAARELARLVLPVSVYTEWYWKIDLHNLFHFLRLRLDPRAQAEIREYAAAVAAIIRDGWPLAWEAFENYTLGQTPLSRPEAEAIRLLGLQADPQRLAEACERAGLAAGERRELAAKLRRIGILQEEAR
jgi:thymidylate synthase (FAD)